MWERFVKTALEADQALLLAEPEGPHEVYRIFLRAGLSEAEAARLRDLFRARPLIFSHGYPMASAAAKLPGPVCYIIVSDVSTGQRFLGDSLGEQFTEEQLGRVLLDEDAGRGTELAGFMSPWTFKLWLASDNMDVTIAYSFLLKQMLIRSLRTLLDFGASDVKIGKISDIVPSAKYLPPNMPAREHFLTMLVTESAVLPNEEERAWAVAGIHISDGSTYEALGEVNALVEVEAAPGDEADE